MVLLFHLLFLANLMNYLNIVVLLKKMDKIVFLKFFVEEIEEYD